MKLKNTTLKLSVAVAALFVSLVGCSGEDSSAATPAPKPGNDSQMTKGGEQPMKASTE